MNGPWQRRDEMVLLPGMALGLVGLLIGWIGCRNTSHWGDQQGWIAVAVLGLLVSVVCVAGWMSVGRGNVRRLQRELAGAARTQLLVAASVSIPERTEPDAWPLVVVDGLTMQHRPDCLLVNGKAVRPSVGGAAVLTKCRMCGA